MNALLKMHLCHNLKPTAGEFQGLDSCPAVHTRAIGDKHRVLHYKTVVLKKFIEPFSSNSKYLLKMCDTSLGVRCHVALHSDRVSKLRTCDKAPFHCSGFSGVSQSVLQIHWPLSVDAHHFHLISNRSHPVSYPQTDTESCDCVGIDSGSPESHSLLMPVFLEQSGKCVIT